MTAHAPSLQDTLHQAAQQLALDLQPNQVDQLLAYLALLQQWNAVYNLTAVRDPDQMLRLHVIDCLAAAPALQRHIATNPRFSVLDVGSGAGLPGIVFAILHPQAQVSCIDTVGKKAAFIRQAAGELKLPGLTSIHGRVEKALPQAFDVISSRAFASLTDFISLTRRHLKPRGVWMAMKGKVPTDEMSALPPDIDVFHVEPLQVPGLDAERCLIWMRQQPV
jgi:16S rRNA (guanine527-N7)-methyltransferase